MTTVSRMVLSAIRSMRRSWPLPFGRDVPSYLGAVATRMGLLTAAWYEFQPGLWMQLNVRDLVQQTILLEGVWDPALTKFVQQSLGPGDVFVDVGAHVGYFTLLASRAVGPTGAVLAIEPNPFALRQLEANVARSRVPNVRIERTACGDSDGVVSLYLPSESNSSMASLYGGSGAGAKIASVPCTTVDGLCERGGMDRVTLVKIDVEGAEVPVLRGMKGLMKRQRPAIVLELYPELLEAVGTPLPMVLALLEECDYVLEPLGGHANYVCRPKGPAARGEASLGEAAREAEPSVDPRADL